MRYELTQIGRRFYVVDTKRGAFVGVARTDSQRQRYAFNRQQAEMLVAVCNMVEKDEA